MAEIESIESSQKPSSSGDDSFAGKNKQAENIANAKTDPQSDLFITKRQEEQNKQQEKAEIEQQDLRKQRAEKAKEIFQRRFINPINEARDKTTGAITGLTNRTNQVALDLTKPITGALEKTVVNPLNTAQASAQTALSEYMTRFINISDKVAAVFGEREKDIRDKLSNSFVKIEGQVYDLMEKIDASFEQKDHNREKKTKDPEKYDPENSGRVDNKLA